MNETVEMQPDMGSAAFRGDPHGHFREWLRAAPAHHLAEDRGWLVLGYDDVTSILRAADRVSSSPNRRGSPADHLLAGNDPPHLGDVRRALAPYFSRECVQRQAPCIERAVRELLRDVRAHESFDWMDFARTLSLRTACEWLGLRTDNAPALLVAMQQASSWELLSGNLSGGGLLPDLIASGRFEQQDVVQLCLFFLFASTMTVHEFAGNALHFLLGRPAWMEVVRHDPAQLPAVIAELLRLVPPVLVVQRRALAPLPLSSLTIPEGGNMFVAIAAANRDPAAFEEPDELRLLGSSSRPLAFGAGAHHCLGTHLARLEMLITFQVLFAEFPQLAPAESLDDVVFGGAPMMHGPERLLVCWTR